MRSRVMVQWRRMRLVLELVRFEHTVFALPFALVAMLTAARGLPEGRIIIWILVAMVGARTAAMAYNRLVDARLDARNPRTANRALPKRLLKPTEVAMLCAISCAVFLLAAVMLNPLTLMLSPVALLWVLGYSHTKRFTSLCHLWLGLGLGMAPAGAWIAVTGQLTWAPVLLSAAVMLWTAGFDIIYSLQDVEFDRSERLRSVPVWLGAERAIGVARLVHVASVILLLRFGKAAGMGPAWLLGVAAVALLWVIMHTMVNSADTSRAEKAALNINGWTGVLLLAATLLDWLVFWR